MAKLIEFKTDKLGVYMLGFHCPGCDYAHVLAIKQYREGGNPQWDFNGDYERPTFKPSLLVYTDNHAQRCHSFIRDGRIQFLSDCGHKLAGQTVEIPEWEEAGGG